MARIKKLKSKGEFNAIRLFFFVFTFLLVLGYYFISLRTFKLNESQRSLSLVTSGTTSTSCPYSSISELKQYETYPISHKEFDGNGRRHIVDPPKDGKITLVCCETTAGSLNVAVHHNWAKIGADRFLTMVKNDYFSSKVALMRCMKNFICQFGIAGIPELNKEYRSIIDDPNWLPEGPTHRENDFGTSRFAKGYFAYAGGGKNSRSNQLIVALKDNRMLGGGSPWEVPFGEVVGSESFVTLSKISTVYGDKGPPQGLLRKEGSSENIAKQYPDLDYMTACNILDERDI